MNARCQCGAVHFTTPTPKPLALYHCHCTLCRRQSASAFGTSAIFPAFPLPLSTQPIAVWARPTASGHIMLCYFCKVCGSRMVHAREGEAAGEGDGTTVSVKGGVIEGLDWGGAEHLFCEQMVVKMDIPVGVKTWQKDSDEWI